MGSGASIDGHVTQPAPRVVYQRHPPPGEMDRGHPRPGADWNVPQIMNRHNDALVVIAIDFGMTFTGYAFAFMHDPNKVYMSSKKLGADRVPTTVLLDEGETLHSFGYQAEEKYLQLVKAGQHKSWRYYERFKMSLYSTVGSKEGENIRRDSPVYDTEKRSMAAIVLFTKVIVHLKSIIEKDVFSEANGVLTPRDFKWLITIPAIWGDSAKQFMREAALNAGIDRDRLDLVLEPEAASAYCIEQAAQWQRQYFDKNGAVTNFSTGFKYILADLGGGTADICVHEILPGDELKEICSATGGALGGTCVNSEFEAFWIKLVGADVMKEFKEKLTEQYLDFMKTFERKKRNFGQDDGQKDIKLSLDPSFVKLIKDKNDESLKDIIPNSEFEDKVKFNSGNNSLTIRESVVKAFFSKSLEGIIKKLREILSETSDNDVKTLILVGGYSESPYLRKYIKTELNQLAVLEDADARLAVLRGAVISGFKPRIIQERRSRFSYGYYMTELFDPKRHPEDLRIFSNNAYFCDKVFIKQISKGDVLRFEQAFKYISRNHLQMEGKFSPFKVRIVRSTKKNPRFCTDEDECDTVGTINVLPPEGGWRDVTNLELSVRIGQTEFMVSVREYGTQNFYEADISFL